MKNALSYLGVVLGLVAIVFVFIQNQEINRLSAQLELATINTEFQAILKPTKNERTIEFGCVIHVEEHFGKFAKWDILVNGMQHQITGAVVTLTHQDSAGISRAWFPPRSNNGGAGNSVSTSENSYVVKLASKYNSGKAVSLFSRLMKVCHEFY